MNLRGEKIYFDGKTNFVARIFLHNLFDANTSPVDWISLISFKTIWTMVFHSFSKLRSHISIGAKASVLQDGQTMMGKKEERKSNKLVRSMWFSVVFPLIFWWHRFGIHWNGNIGRKSPILLVAFWERPPQNSTALSIYLTCLPQHIWSRSS